MALVFRQSITTNPTEIYSLYDAINCFLIRPLTSDEKLSAVEFLSAEPLKKVAAKLSRKYQRECGYWRVFSITFSPQELLAIHLCIRNYQANPLLDVVLGKVQQRILNLSNHIEITYNYQKR